MRTLRFARPSPVVANNRTWRNCITTSGRRRWSWRRWNWRRWLCFWLWFWRRRLRRTRCRNRSRHCLRGSCTCSVEVSTIAEDLWVRVPRVARHVCPLERARRSLGARQASGQNNPDCIHWTSLWAWEHESHVLCSAGVRITAITTSIAATSRR